MITIDDVETPGARRRKFIDRRKILEEKFSKKFEIVSDIVGGSLES